MQRQKGFHRHRCGIGQLHAHGGAACHRQWVHTYIYIFSYFPIYKFTLWLKFNYKFIQDKWSCEYGTFCKCRYIKLYCRFWERCISPSLWYFQSYFKRNLICAKTITQQWKFNYFSTYSTNNNNYLSVLIN